MGGTAKSDKMMTESPILGTIYGILVDLHGAWV